MTKAGMFAEPGGEAALEEGSEFTPKFDSDGLVPVVATDAKTGEVLMLAYMNSDALARTIGTGEAHYWSRSRRRVWRKGEISGNCQRVIEMRTDCDQDAIWLKVEVSGTEATCHTGRRSCFYRAVPLGADPSAGLALRWVDSEQKFDPEAVYGHADAAKGTLKSS